MPDHPASRIADLLP
ncbi:hypothetical protein ACQR0Z_33215 [Bradyrhizobium sp. HKCCYLS3077]